MERGRLTNERLDSTKVTHTKNDFEKESEIKVIW
jgi:hypothetical protein